MRRHSLLRRGLLGLAVVFGSTFLDAQSPVQPCDATPKPAWCSAVPGDRAEGWLIQNRSEVMARNGMVASSQPLAVQAGLDVLRRGGNAIDAAVATAAVLTVVEPMNVGPAGDLFAIIYIAKENKLYALNASGKAPSGQTLARMNALGYTWDASNWGPGSGMPAGGILTVTVPGTVWGWHEVLRRFGTMTFRETLQPAIDYAEDGFPVSERIAADWRLPRGLGPTPADARGCCTQMDPDSVATWYINGRPPVAGQVHRNPGLARTFRILQEKGRDGFYAGEVAQALVAKSKALGGTMTLADLSGYSGEWVDVATTTYRGYTVSTLPPPAQTWATDEMLNILEACVPVWAPGQTLATLGPASPAYWHVMVEAKKLAFADRDRHLADREFMKVDVRDLFAPRRAKRLRGLIRVEQAAADYPDAPGGTDTEYVAAADHDGNLVSFIQSNFMGFGSGVVEPDTGIILQNRGHLFSLDETHPNCIGPHKRCAHTLAPGMIFKDGKPYAALGLKGGHVQPQVQVQLISNLIDHGILPQQAISAPRFNHIEGLKVGLEPDISQSVKEELTRRGHQVVGGSPESFGGAHVILIHPESGAFVGGSDPRKGGCALGF